MDDRSKPFVMSFNEGTANVLSNCERRITEAREWLVTGKWADQFDIELGTDESVAFYERQSHQLTLMERSLYLCVFKLVALAGGCGGMQLWTDGEDAVYWRVASGLEGGLVCHSGSYGKHRTPIGEWGLHT